MVSILNKERKVETRGHIKLGVMEPKMKKQIRTFCTWTNYTVSVHMKYYGRD